MPRPPAGARPVPRADRPMRIAPVIRALAGRIAAIAGGSAPAILVAGRPAGDAAAPVPE
jgi:hypothetical protein